MRWRYAEPVVQARATQCAGSRMRRATAKCAGPPRYAFLSRLVLAGDEDQTELTNLDFVTHLENL